ncbi:aminotransferase class I/II-fold pyridoxal phosphate-dependent enzyme [Gelidibacter japonicus]|uniref:aminotransferase class I/II-fold pyridoxal phosphate-dependent enzyme n=1 Tax=Gelidibacter japonicus TaxID=1962232 RepID=UPI003A952C1E
MTVDQFPDRTIVENGKTYLYFGGTNYLGMATHQHFQQLLFESVKKWGTAYGSSRNSNIKLKVYDEAEVLLAKNCHAEAALTVSSGSLAGKLVIDQLSASHNLFFHYPKTHPAILKKSSLPLFVDGNLHPRLTDTSHESVVIAADAIVSLAVRATNFEFLNNIAPNKKVTLLLDESHSLGVLGTDGMGIFKEINHPVLFQKIMISSLTKAYGCSGGVIVGPQNVIKSIQDEANFISASGMNPIFLQSYVDAQHLFQTQLEKLKKNLKKVFGNANLPSHFNYDENYPVIYSSSNSIFNDLKSKDIIITNFKYPNYEVMMNRIVITANHTSTDLEQLKSALMLSKP